MSLCIIFYTILDGRVTSSLADCRDLGDLLEEKFAFCALKSCLHYQSSHAHLAFIIFHPYGLAARGGKFLANNASVPSASSSTKRQANNHFFFLSFFPSDGLEREIGKDKASLSAKFPGRRLEQIDELVARQPYRRGAQRWLNVGRR